MKPIYFLFVIFLFSCGPGEVSTHTSELRRSRPSISSITPKNAQMGDVITIDGANFGNKRNAGWVALAAQPHNDFPTVLSWSDNRITARLGHEVVGEASLTVVAANGSNTRDVIFEIEPMCATPTNYQKTLKLLTPSSEAFDVIPSVDCSFAIVGKATSNSAPSRNRGFVVRTNAEGTNIAGPKFFDDVAELRSISRVADGYIVVGTTHGGHVYLNHLDDGLQAKTGWPKVYQTRAKEIVRGAAVAHGQIAVVGKRGDSSFLYQFSLDGVIRKQRSLVDQDIGNKWARGVAAVDGGFVVVGERWKIQPNLQTVKVSWVGRVGSDGASYTEYDLRTGETLVDAVAYDSANFAAVGYRPLSGASATLSNPTLSNNFDHYSNGNVKALYGVEKNTVGFVAVGTGRADGTISRLDCAGAQRDLYVIDGGGDEQLNAVANLYPKYSGNELGHFAVGRKISSGKTEAWIAWRQRFPVIDPTAVLTVNSTNSISASYQDTVTLDYSVDDADFYQVRKLSGPGPAPDETVIPVSNSGTGSQTLTFNNLELKDCLADGCGATIYEVVASRRPEGRCSDDRKTVAQVTVLVDPDPATIQLQTSSTVIMMKYGVYDPLDLIGPAHPIAGLGQNRCINNLGVPYGTTHTLFEASNDPAPGSASEIDDRIPALLLYDADAEGRPTTLRGYALGSPFVTARPTIAGDDWVSFDDWWGHWGGWHTGEGGMTIVTPGEPSFVTSDWMTPYFVPPVNCGSRNAFCGASLPWIPHRALWDVHVFYPPSGADPVVEFMTSMSPELSDPCAAIDPMLSAPGLPGCDSGQPSLGLIPFFQVDANDAPIPIVCP